MNNLLLLILLTSSCYQIIISFKIDFNKNTKLYSTIDDRIQNEKGINFIQNSGPVLSFTMPKLKNIRLHIVGCIHSSPTAAMNVMNVINQAPNPKAIVLELCSKRYKSLAEDLVLMENNLGDNKIDREKEINNIDKVGFLVYILSILTYAQRHLKVTPGAEFLAAMSLSERKNIPIEMADEDVDVIINNLKRVGYIKSFDVINTLQSMAFSITGNYDYISKSNNDIGNYNFSKIQWLNILPTFFRDSNLVRDTLLLMSPSVIPLTIVTFIANIIMENYQSLELMSSFDGTSSHLYQITDTLTNLFTIYWSIVVINIFRYVIVDRDLIIANKIRRICVKISDENKDNQNEINDVICVVGMLHSNGLCRYLLEEELRN